MSVRGVLGFRVGGRDKITYNNSNSDQLEEGILDWCRSVKDWKEVKRKILAMKRVDGAPTDEQILEVAIALDTEPIQGANWYIMLRSTQGCVEKILNARYYENYSSFMLRSKLCEFAYIINLDMMELEVYNRKVGGNGRYCTKSNQYPSLAKRIDLMKL